MKTRNVIPKVLAWTVGLMILATSISAYADMVTFSGGSGRISTTTATQFAANPGCNSGVDWTMGTALCLEGKIGTMTGATSVGISSGLLELLTGDVTSSVWTSGGRAGEPTNDVYNVTYGPGSFYIVGGEGSLPGGTNLLSAGFTTAMLSFDCYNASNPSSPLTTCTGTFSLSYDVSTFNATLWTDLGFALPPPPPGSGTLAEGSMKIKLNSPMVAGDTSGTIHSTSFDTSGSFSNTAVPEPATLALIGTGLVSIGAVIRRRIRQE